MSLQPSVWTIESRIDDPETEIDRKAVKYRIQ